MAGCFHPGGALKEFADSEYKFSFKYPDDWVRSESRKDLILAYFAKGDSFFMVGAARDTDWVFATLEQNFLNFVEEYRQVVSSAFILESYNDMKVNGIDGILFYADMGDKKAIGYYFMQNATEFYSIGVTDDDNSFMLDEFNKSIQTINVPDDKSTIPAIIQKINRNKKMTPEQIGESIDYGRELLKNRNVNVKNYYLAMQEFRSVLASLYNLKKRPEEYDTALRLLELTKTFRHEAFATHRFRLERYIALLDRENAMREAEYILKLYPEDKDPQHVYAVRKYAQASRIRF